MKNLLIDKKFDTRDFKSVSNGWYAPLEILRQYKSVIHADHICTSSSAGDWDGFFVQKIGKRSYVIEFSQQNNYPYSGFTLYTGRVIFSYTGHYSHEELMTIACDLMYNDVV